MKILFLAPHPYYIDRGTPIDDDLMLKALSERGYEIDLVVYHEGKDVHYPNINLHRIPRPWGVRHVNAGLSWQKIICDISFFCVVLSLLFKKKYDLIHAVEESVFIAVLIRFFSRIHYLYDMDSSVAELTVEKLRVPNALKGIFYGIEKMAVKNSLAAIPVCRTLGERVKLYDASKKYFVLEDISILELEQEEAREEDLAYPSGKVNLVYTGNFDVYQGIDLLLEAFKQALTQEPNLNLILVGGSDEHLKKYQEKVRELGISDNIQFKGRKPLRQMGAWLKRADILISPRLYGTNTPMKIYSYLHSGKPVIATRIESHTQVLTEELAQLADPNPKALSQAVLSVVRNSELRRVLGEKGRLFAETNHSLRAYRKKIFQIYDWVEGELAAQQKASFSQQTKQTVP